MRRLRLQRASLRALAGALAFVLAAAASTAGFRFVWCAPMAQARLHCCCPTPSSEHDTLSRACCEERHVPSLPGVDGHHDAPKTVAAPLLAVLPLWAWLGVDASREGVTRRSSDVEARAGPGARLHAQNSVFLL